MRVIPSFVNRSSSKVPLGELKFFDLLKNAKNSKDLIALHSLELPVHIKKRTGEMDFVILFPPHGIIGVEVKSHKNIYVQNMNDLLSQAGTFLSRHSIFSKFV